MSLILDGTNGVSDIDGSAATPAIRGTDTNTGIFFGTDVIGFSEGGAECARFNADAQFVASAGTASLPVITTTGDVNTGIFFPAADTIGFAEGGAEAMRIDSSGNVRVGTTSALSGYRLATVGGSTFISDANKTVTGGGNIQMYTSDSQAADIGPSIGFGGYYIGTSSDTEWAQIAGRKENGTSNNFSGYLQFSTRANGGSNAERARIDSSGNLLVGTTAQIAGATSRMVVDYATGDFVATLRNTNASPLGLYIKYSQAVNSTGSEFLYLEGTTGLRASIRSNGGIANYSANDVNLSDRREKTNFAPAKNYLDTICAIPVQTFNYIDQNNEDDPGLTLGVIAQDVQEVAPELVMESDWGTKENPKMRLSIYQTDLQYALMKSIQELKAELDTTKARLAALEGA